MSSSPLKMVFIGLSLSSSWGNGHATTYRALLRALFNRGHRITFLECDRPWYSEHRDLANPSFCKLSFYSTTSDLSRYITEIRDADIVVIGSYVVDGVLVAEFVRQHARFLAFYDIDTPVTLAMLARGENTYVSAASIVNYDLYLSFTGGPTLGVLEQRYGARAARPLYCAVDPKLYLPLSEDTEKRWNLAYLGTYSLDRQPALEQLLFEVARRAPRFRFVVAGPQYPEHIKWPNNVEHFEHLPPSDHAAFYNAADWTLNITRSDMREAGYSPSVRLFEASACATPIISDYWEGLDDFLAIDKEIIVASSPDAVLSCLNWPEQKRQQLAVAARSHTLRAHTAAHRAYTLEQYISEFCPLTVSA